MHTPDANLPNLLRQIYRQHRPGLYALALSITRNPDRAEDAIHNAFARLIAATNNPTGDLIAYTFAAVRNAAIDELRTTTPLTPLDAHTTSPDPASGPALTAEFADDARHLRLAIDNLDPPSREVVLLKLHADLTFDQIATLLHEPLQTVASRYRRALLTLRDALATPLAQQVKS